MTLRQIANFAREEGIEFLVCGGYAVNAWQVIRKTGDIDLLVRAGDAGRWKKHFLESGYELFHESDAFLQLRPGTLTSWPVDLLLVDDRTFDTLKQQGKAFRFGDADCVVPSAEHLIAMKLHALKSAGDARLRQDALDIIDLADRTGMDLAGEHFRDLCSRFGSDAIRERILVYAGKTTLR